jgi:hypothetical protein
MTICRAEHSSRARHPSPKERKTSRKQGTEDVTAPGGCLNREHT